MSGIGGGISTFRLDGPRGFFCSLMGSPLRHKTTLFVLSLQPRKRIHVALEPVTWPALARCGPRYVVHAAIGARRIMIVTPNSANRQIPGRIPGNGGHIA